MTLVLDFAPDEWSISTRLVAIALADRVNRETGEAWASIADLSRRTGIGPRQVRRHLAVMEKAGVIRRQARFRDNGSQQSNLWIWVWTVTGTSLSSGAI